MTAHAGKAQLRQTKTNTESHKHSDSGSQHERHLVDVVEALNPQAVLESAGALVDAHVRASCLQWRFEIDFCQGAKNMQKPIRSGHISVFDFDLILITFLVGFA